MKSPCEIDIEKSKDCDNGAECDGDNGFYDLGWGIVLRVCRGWAVWCNGW